MTRSFLLSSSACAIIAVVALPTAAQAQTSADTGAAAPATPPVPAAAPQEEASNAIGDIVVTARRKSELLRDVPVAVTALAGDQLVTKNVTQLINLTAIVPSFTLTYGSVQPYTFVRGFGSGGSPSFDQAVGKFIDNVSYGRDQDGRIPLFDMERVEVLKGPQVLLYGNSTTAGALNLTTRKPGDHFELDATASHEFNNNETQIQGGVTVPLTSFASLRVSGLYQNLDKGWVHNTLTNNDEPQTKNNAVRGILRLTPAPNLEILLKGEYEHLRDYGTSLQAIVQAASPAAKITDATRDDSKSVNTNVAPFFQKEFAFYNGQTFQADINYSDFLGGTIGSTTAYRSYRYAAAASSQTQYPIFITPIGGDYNQFSQEVRYNGTFGRLDLVVGGYYQRDNSHLFSLQDFNLAAIGAPPAAGGVPFARFSTFDQRSNSWSLYTDFTYHLTSKLSIEAGVRYAKIVKDAEQTTNPIDIVTNVGLSSPVALAESRINHAYDGLLKAITGAVPHDLAGLHSSEDHFQPQVVVQYKYDPHNMVYVKFVRGVKAGGFDWLYGGNDPSKAAFQPEAAESFEAGAKGLIAGNKLEYALTAFRTTFTNLQVSVFQRDSFLVANVGKARTQGIELELHWRPVQGLTLGANGTYLDAKYLSFPGAACTPAQILGTPAGTTCTQDLSDTPTPYSSKWAGTLSVDYEQSVGSYVLGGGVSLFAKTKYNAGSTNNPLEEQKGYAQIDTHLDLKPQNGWWTLSFFGQNLTDQKFLTFTTGAPGVRGAIIGSQSRGRQLGLRFGVKF